VIGCGEDEPGLVGPTVLLCLLESSDVRGVEVPQRFVPRCSPGGVQEVHGIDGGLTQFVQGTRQAPRGSGPQLAEARPTVAGIEPEHSPDHGLSKSSRENTMGETTVTGEDSAGQGVNGENFNTDPRGTSSVGGEAVLEVRSQSRRGHENQAARGGVRGVMGPKGAE